MICNFDFGYMDSFVFLWYIAWSCAVTYIWLDSQQSFVTRKSYFIVCLFLITEQLHLTLELFQGVYVNGNCTVVSIMMTSSNETICRVTGPLCGEFTGQRWIPLTKDSHAELWCFFFYLRPNKRLSKQSRRLWFESPSCSLCCHCNGDCQLPYFS